MTYRLAPMSAPILVLTLVLLALPLVFMVLAMRGIALLAVPALFLVILWAHLGCGHTWARSNPWTVPVLLPDRRIDCILVGRPRRGGAGHVVRCSLAGTEPITGVVPSDHYAVLAGFLMGGVIAFTLIVIFPAGTIRSSPARVKGSPRS
jgi:pimeloyl-ACP methyl ester carboxylesterase